MACIIWTLGFPIIGVPLLAVAGGASIDHDQILESVSDNVKDKWTHIWESLYDNGKPKKPMILVEEINHSLPYEKSQKIITNNLHAGQQKLLLSEIQFLTTCLDSYLDQRVVIYAGAAPSKKAMFAMQYFPNLVWIFVDPNPFKIEIDSNTEFNKHKSIKFVNSDELPISKLNDYNKNKNSTKSDVSIYIINEYFTDNLAKKLKAIKNTLFVSDVRTSIIDNNAPSDLDIVWNLSMQWVWLKELKSEYSVLKFRYPFYTDSKEKFESGMTDDIKKHFVLSKKITGIDFLDNYYKKRLVYMPGKLYLQMYSPITSTETRLFISKDDIEKSHNYGTLTEYEEKFVFFNKIARSYLIYQNKYTDKSIGFDNCHDCAAASLLWETYISKYKLSKKTTPLKEVKKYLLFLKRPLLRDGHGVLC
jgi:hypothetical protein